MVGLSLVGCVEESDKPEQNDSTDTTDTDAYFSLHTNGVTILCLDASVGDTGVVNDITYTKRDRAAIDSFCKRQ